MSSLAAFQGLHTSLQLLVNMPPFCIMRVNSGDNCYSAGGGDALRVIPVSVHGTHLTDVPHPILSSDQIKHVLEVAVEHRGRMPE